MDFIVKVELEMVIDAVDVVTAIKLAKRRVQAVSYSKLNVEAVRAPSV